MEQVTIRTENGKWSHVVQDEDDPFLELIESMREVGALDNEIVLTGTVAEVVETQWPAYLRLLDWIRYGELASPRDTLHDVPSYLTPRMMRLAEVPLSQGIDGPIMNFNRRGLGFRPTPIIHEFRTVESAALPPSRSVHLREVYQLSRILSFPAVWRECVAVDENDLTLSQRVDYLQGVAESGALGEFGDIPLVTSVWHQIHLAIGEHEEYAGAYYVFAAIVRVALLASHQSDKNVLDWSTVLWKELRELYTRSLPSGVLAKVLVILHDFLNCTSSCPIRIPINSFGYQNDRLILEVPSWRKLYDTALLGYPKDVHPYSLGLHCILDTDPRFLLDAHTFTAPVMGDAPHAHFGRGLRICDLVTWLHHTLMTFVSSNRAYFYGHVKWSNVSIPRSQFPILVEVIDSVLGRETLMRMKDSLNHYLETRESGRASSFVRVIEDYEKDESQRSVADLVAETLLEYRRKYYETL